MEALFPSPKMMLVLMFVGEVIMVRTRLSADAARKADRGSLPVLFTVIFASVVAAWLAARLLPGSRVELVLALDATQSQLLQAAGLSTFVAGLILRWYSIRYLGRLFTYDVAVARDHRVIDTGPYRHIRHPAYAGSLLSFIGIGVCSGNLASLTALVPPIAGAFIHRIAVEEAALTMSLGPAYVDYARRTWRLLPFVY